MMMSSVYQSVLCVLFSFLCVVGCHAEISGQTTSRGAAGILGDSFVEGHDVQLNLHGPEQSTADISESLVGLVMLENQRRRAQHDMFEQRWRQLLDAEKIWIRNSVEKAFEPLQALLTKK